MKNPKIAVIYKSKYGSTRQYARWISESLNGDLLDIDNVETVDRLKNYQVIIFGSFIRIGKILISQFISDNWEFLKSKHIILFSVSGTNPQEPEIQEYYKLSLSEHIRSKIKFFSFWGHHTKLDFSDSLLMSFPKTIYFFNRIFNPKSDYIKKAGQMFMISSNVDKKYIRPLVDYVKSL